MRILFLGSSRFSCLVLEKMLGENLNVTGIITQPDKPSGRGHKLMPTPVKVMGEDKGIKVYTFDKIRLHQKEVENIDYDIAVVASFGQILPLWFLEFKPCINVHPSLLPKYRGATPMQSAILNGDDKTGVTIMKVAMEVDAGDIILQQQVPLNDEYFSQLEEKLALLGGEMVAKVINQYENGTVTFTPQDNSEAVKVEKFFKEDGKLDFSQCGKDIINRVRALGEELGCYFFIDDTMIKTDKVVLLKDNINLEPCKILNDKKHFIIGCKDGAIEILNCKAPSGRMVSGRDFINGHNEILWKMVK